eukprot:TRINITY_DN1117_c0_g1_i1.p1 TRINITY_DN1117_c0_g1~~TRINITY_DN1117_c0_g1_i1.p1  ORF type:complete len:941 (+),score=233.59 TRINITY_DN1117_c0_g1_i1:2249-5071(+)
MDTQERPAVDIQLPSEGKEDVQEISASTSEVPRPHQIRGGITKIRSTDAAHQGALLVAALSLCYMSGKFGYSSMLVIILFFVLWAHFNRKSALLERSLRDALAGRSLLASKAHVARRTKEEEEKEERREEILDLLDDDTEPSEEFLAKIAELLSNRKRDSMVFPAEVMVINAFIGSAWPQISLHIEKKIRKSIRDALSTRQEKSSTFIKRAELKYVRFQQGIPIVEDIRAYQHGWSDGQKDCLVIEMRFKFEGLVRVGIDLGFLVGNFGVTLGVTNFDWTFRLTFTERTYYPPFIKFCNMKVIDDPNLVFTMHLGGFDPSKIPLVEHYLKEKLLRKIRTSVWNFSFRGTQTPKLGTSVLLKPPTYGDYLIANGVRPPLVAPTGTTESFEESKDPPTPKDLSPEKQARTANLVTEKPPKEDREVFHGGILHIMLDSVDRGETTISVPEELQDPNANSTAWHLRTAYDQQKTEWMKCSVQLGDLEKNRRETVTNEDGQWAEQIRYFVSPKDIVLEYEEPKTKVKQSRLKRLWLYIRVAELTVLSSSAPNKKNKKKEVKRQFKGQIDMLKALGTKLDEDVVQHASIALSPKDGGYLRLRLLWEPVLSVYSINHLVVCPGIRSWSRRANQPIGVINVQVIKAENVDVPEKNVLNVKVAYGPSEEAAEKFAQQTKYQYNTRNPFWDESFDFIANDFLDMIYISIIDYQNRNKVCARARIPCWTVMCEKYSLNMYESFPLLDGEGKIMPGGSILVGFIVYPTTSVNCHSKRFAFETMHHLSSPLSSPLPSSEEIVESIRRKTNSVELKDEIEPEQGVDDNAFEAFLDSKEELSSSKDGPDFSVDKKSPIPSLTRPKSDPLEREFSVADSNFEPSMSGSSMNPSASEAQIAAASSGTRAALNDTALHVYKKFAGLVRRKSTTRDGQVVLPGGLPDNYETSDANGNAQ